MDIPQSIQIFLTFYPVQYAHFSGFTFVFLRQVSAFRPSALMEISGDARFKPEEFKTPHDNKQFDDEFVGVFLTTTP